MSPVKVLGVLAGEVIDNWVDQFSEEMLSIIARSMVKKKWVMRSSRWMGIIRVVGGALGKTRPLTKCGSRKVPEPSQPSKLMVL